MVAANNELRHDVTRPAFNSVRSVRRNHSIYFTRFAICSLVGGPSNFATKIAIIQMKVNSIYRAGDNFVNDNLSNNKYMNRINSYYFILFENKDISASIILITTKDIVFCVTEAI